MTTAQSPATYRQSQNFYSYQKSKKRRSNLSKQSKSKKMTRGQSIAIAQAARRLPEGIVSDRGQLQFTPEQQQLFRSQSPSERGRTYALGAAMYAQGYLLLYDTLDRLGVRIIRPISGNPPTIVCRHKTYEGNNQAELLLEILRDRLENFNYLTPGGFDDEKD